MACGELFLITRYFDRVKNARLGVETDTGDDCTLLNIPEKRTLVISTDTLVAGNHFLSDIDPADLAYKALAVNLNDPAMMGVEPAWLILALILPGVDETWLGTFSGNLFIQLDCYDMQLIDGDVTHGPLSVTLGIHGFMPPGRVMKRVGAKPVDWIYVTGTPGDNAAGLAVLQNRLTMGKPSGVGYLLVRHSCPILRVLQSQALRNLATSAIGLSDDLISDLGHILKASDCGARVDPDAMPYSGATLCRTEPEQVLYWALAGGGDYGLYFIIPELNRGALDVVLGHLGAYFTCIGQIAPEGEGLQLIHDGKPVVLDLKGYDHFAQSRRGATSPEHAQPVASAGDRF